MAKDGLHDGMPELLSMDNMANGAVYEMVNDALKKLAQNIADPNTEPTQKRRVNLSIEAKPYKDRSGAELSVKVEAKLAGIRPADGMMYIAQRGGEYLAFARNTKQETIPFEMDDAERAARGDEKPKAN